MNFPQVNWIKSPKDATGQDQLGVRFPSEYIYASLLPGITNVTDRCRYYSFYPWIIWAFEKHQGTLKQKNLFEVIRLADCLFTLIGIQHSRNFRSEHDSQHGGLIGSVKLGAALNEIQQTDQSIRLSRYAVTEDDPDRYFKNKYGGLGQYYLGPLRDAGIISYNDRQQLCYTNDKGAPIAEAFDETVNRKEFFSILDRDQVCLQDLDNLVDFCPCKLTENKVEQDILLDFFFERTDLYKSPIDENRRLTLLLLLDFIAKLSDSDNTISISGNGVHRFLAASYGDSFDADINWKLENSPLKLLQLRIFWRQYYANELLSYAVQTLFWAGLTTIATKKIRPLNAPSYGRWLAKTFSDVYGFDGAQKFTEAVEITKAYLPLIEDWHNEQHEIQLAWTIEKVIRDRNILDKEATVVSLALKLLLSLIARWEDTMFRDNFPLDFPAEYSLSYPINLATLFEKAETQWKAFDIEDWIGWLGSQWGIETHLMIALRKLRYENLDTFKIVPSEEGLRVVEAIGNKTVSEMLLPGFTSPRLKQTLQLMTDLGVLILDENRLKITDLGKSILEESLDV